jgi:hypothetical protein
VEWAALIRRRRGRGTIMVETLIVLIIMIIAVNIGMLFYVIFATKVYTMRKADMDAWNEALPGCEGGALGQLLEAPSALITAAADDQGRNDPGSQGLTVGARVKSHSESVDKWTLKSGSRVACNEITQDDTDFISVIQWAIKEIIP